MRRLDRLYGRILDQITEARATGNAPPGSLQPQLAALMQLRADRRRLLLSYDAEELTAIIARLGKPGTRLRVPQ